MTPLDDHVSARMGDAVRGRMEWTRRSRALPAPLGEFMRHKLWKWPYRHMRGFPASVGLEPTARGGWELTANGKAVATTLPLADWIGPIDRPVTIIAGGPTARDYPFRELAGSGRLVVAVNGVPALLAEMGVRPDAWIVSDPRLGLQIQTNFPNAPGTPLALTAFAAASIAESSADELASRRLCLIERVNQWHGVRSLEDRELLDLNERSGRPYLFHPAGVMKSVVGWSRRPELGFFSGCTVTFTALQIVIGLGARDIEIAGMDLGGSGHAYKEGKGSIPSSLAADYERGILPAFERMGEALRGTGVVVRNLSPVCPLPREIFAA
jgi:Kdo-III transferase WaaZ